ncbi:MAG: carbohydrate kinase family protein [Candidatus Thorarchaeota archaeon]
MDYEKILEMLRNPPSLEPIVILPDFFVDHFLITGKLDDFIENLRHLANQGGGNLLGTHQFIRRGGNSANTASALYSLGLTPKLIVTTDEYGKRLLESLTSDRLDLKNVHTDGSLSSTVSIEVEHEGRRVNLMVSDSGSAASFGFNNLNESDLNEISSAGLVALFNLNHNTHAVELTKDLFSYVRNSGEAITYLDAGDPSGRPAILRPLVHNVFSEGLVDILGMNENEAAWFAWAVSGGDDKWKASVSEPDKWMSAARYVSLETGVQINLHTPFFSAVVNDDSIIATPSFSVEPRIMCGAGDAWNAGNIYGLVSKLESKDRLILANALAALYVSMGTAEHPTRTEIISFLENKPILSRQGKKLLKLT